MVSKPLRFSMRLATALKLSLINGSCSIPACCCFSFFLLLCFFGCGLGIPSVLIHLAGYLLSLNFCDALRMDSCMLSGVL